MNIESKQLKEEIINLLYKKGLFLPFFTITLIRGEYIYFKFEDTTWVIKYPF